jgi:tetratricopeptide (TPR) repeat protein
MRLLQRRILLSLFSLLGTSGYQTPFAHASFRRKSTHCRAASAEDGLSAAARARRDEERRRLERREEVVVGQTSAKAGAKDLEINPRVTEQAWLSQANEIERQIFHLTERGMTAMKMMQIETATEAFDRVFQLKPDAYLWQAGIAKYYLDDWKGAAEIFSRNAISYELLFGEPASEERIWRSACLLKIYTSKSRTERKSLDQDGGIETLLTPLPDENELTDSLLTERRKVMRIAQDLFTSSINKDTVGVILSRAKLFSIGGRSEQQAMLDRKMWKLSAWFYLGLHYDALGEEEDSKRCMKRALQLCPSIGGNADDIVHSLPLIHMARRDWFDEDDFETKEPAKSSAVAKLRTRLQSIQQGNAIDPIIAESIEDSVLKLRHAELKAALKTRGLLCNGTKEELQKRMFHSLVEETTQSL